MQTLGISEDVSKIFRKKPNRIVNRKMQEIFGTIPFTYKAQFVLQTPVLTGNMNYSFVYLCLATFLRTTPYLSEENSDCEGV